MKIAICDDDEDYIEFLKIQIKNAFDFEYHITEYNCGEDLLKTYISEKLTFDVIFLDIQMSGINGVVTAQKIRETDTKVIIVFLTGYQQYAISGYEVEAFRYILKNSPVSVITRNLYSIYNKVVTNKKYVSFTSKGKDIILEPCEITFIESHDKISKIHTLNERYDVYKKITVLDTN